MRQWVGRAVTPMAVAALVAMVLAGCGRPEPQRSPTAAGTTATAGPATTATNNPGTATNPGERALPIYYVAQTAAGPRLQREFHRLPAADPGSAAVREMLAHPTGIDPDYHNPWPQGTSLRAPVTSTADAIAVDLTAASPSDLATQQLVFTVQGALGSTAPVHLLRNGVATGPPIPRGDPYALRSLVQIDAPADGTSTPSPVTVTGEAAVFEATLHWAVVSGTTTIRTGVASTAEGQVFAPFRFTLDLPPGRYTVQISEDDPSDGAGRPVLTDNRTITVT
jgi:Immunoglobulin-like domain of bacterial spore germination/Sporulation and spore germination